VVTSPWELRETAVSCGFDPDSLTERSARRRVSDAGLGRDVVVPTYLRRPPSGPQVVLAGLRLRLSPGGAVAVSAPGSAGEVGDPVAFWRAVSRAAADPTSVARREGWTRLLVRPEGAHRCSLVLRDSDWTLLAAALDLQDLPVLHDAPLERVAARFLGRLDGLEGTSAAELWGRLALEVVVVRRPNRLADTTSLRWYASWGPGGFPAGSGGRATGSAEQHLLMDLTHQRFRLADKAFRVRTLPEWEREEAARDLGLPPRRVMAWAVSPLPVLLRHFDGITPAPLTTSVTSAPVPPAPVPSPPQHIGPQDAHRANGPQDAR
jgi:hypothetical protein